MGTQKSAKTPLAVAKMIRPFHQISISAVRVSINNIFYKLYENLRTRNRTPTHLLPFSGLQFTPAGFSWLQHRPWRIQKLCPRNDSFHSEKSQISTITVLLQVIFDDEIDTESFLPLTQNLTNILSLIYASLFIIVFCCIAAWIQLDISGCQQDFLVVLRWNQLGTF